MMGIISFVSKIYDTTVYTLIYSINHEYGVLANLDLVESNLGEFVLNELVQDLVSELILDQIIVS